MTTDEERIPIIQEEADKSCTKKDVIYYSILSTVCVVFTATFVCFIFVLSKYV